MILAGSDPVLGGNVSSWIIFSDSQLCQQNKTTYIPSNSYETLIQFFGHLPARYFQCILVDSSSRRSAISTHRHDKMHLNRNENARRPLLNCFSYLRLEDEINDGGKKVN